MTFPSRLVPWLPKSVLALRTYSTRTFRQDLLAGMTTGLVALPLAMAFAIASGLTPQAGLYCAVVTGFIISALGGSLVQIGGPTGAFVVVVAGIVAKYGVDGLYMCTMMAGVMLVLLGATRSGSAVKFIPRPVVIGFTNGIAIIIASTQFRDFLGLHLDGTPGDFLGRMRVVVAHLGTATPAAIAVAAVTLGLVVVFNKFVKVVPGTIAGMVGGTLLAWLTGWRLETVGSRFGGVPSGLPPLQLPAFHLSVALTLLAPAVTIALLGAIESLMSAVVSDRMTGDRHNPNVELIAQGVANFVTPMLGGLPATGAIARTATNVRSGARTPVAGMVHALTLLAILVVGARLAAAIPMAVLAGLLFVVAARMGEWHEIPLLLRQTKTDIAVWLATFALTVFADLTVAVEVGMVLAALLYIRRVSNTTTVTRVTAAYVEEGREHVLQDQVIPDDVAIVRIHGPFLFGATDKLEALVDTLDPRIAVVIVRLRNMTAIDATGVRAFEDLVARLKATGRTAVFCGAREQPTAVLRQADFAAVAGPLNICPNIRAALVRAREIGQRVPGSGFGVPGVLLPAKNALPVPGSGGSGF